METAAFCGVNERDFWDMTPRYFSACLSASEKKEREEWERARYISMYSTDPSVFKKKVIRPSDLGLFPWEKPVKKPKVVVDKAEVDAFDKDADEILKKTNPAAYEAYIKGKKNG